jgi:thiol-disulfide isomerase/thioredoxin
VESGMKKFALAAAFVLAGLFSAPAQSRAAVEIVMFEADWCHVCKQFKREVMPKYKDSEYGKDVPISFVMQGGDIWFELKEPIKGFPTFVVIQDGKEAERILGYAGRDEFFRKMSSMFKRTGN